MGSESRCQGTYGVLLDSSEPFRGYRLYQRLDAVTRNGAMGFFGLALRKLGLGEEDKSDAVLPRPSDVILDLAPGELVEVKFEKEIRETFTRPGGTHGLGFMDEMWKFCGKRFRVFKRVNRIMLESTAELRKMKNVVLLENNFCDGSRHYGCDRACFHYWKEAWLARVED